MTLRKIGGMYWFSIGRLRIAICFTRKIKPVLSADEGKPSLRLVA